MPNMPLYEKIKEKKQARKLMEESWQRDWDISCQIAAEETAKVIPTPMIAQQHADQLNDSSPVIQQWKIDDGVCGFAWVTVRPGNCPFANWLKRKELGTYSDYERGVLIWISRYNQSLTLKEAYAKALARELRVRLGIRADERSRID